MKLHELVAMRKNWSGEYPAPSKEVVTLLSTYEAFITQQFKELKDFKIAPSIEGGAMIYWTRNNAYADIEFFNTGEVIGWFSDRVHEPKVWAVQDVYRDLKKIEDYLNEY